MMDDPLATFTKANRAICDYFSRRALHYRARRGQRHMVYRYFTQDGERVLKVYRPTLGARSPSAIERAIKERQVICFLSGQRFPVPEILEEDVLGVRFGAPYLWMTSAGGQTIADVIFSRSLQAESLVGQMGETLAALHGIDTASLVIPDSPIRDPHEIMMEDVFQLRGAGLFTEAEAARLTQIQLPAMRGASLCHLDFHGIQCVACEGRLTAVVDWEEATIADPEIDLAIALTYCELYEASNLSQIFLEAYRSHCEPSADFPRVRTCYGIVHALRLARLLLSHQPRLLERSIAIAKQLLIEHELHGN
ncbi:MAG: aminoglycoside phosphotransferase family protein [Pirellulaceae bacterium]